MKRMIVFVLMFLSALIFILSFMPVIRDSPYSRIMDTCGQIGLGASVALFFVLPGRKNAPPKRN